MAAISLDLLQALHAKVPKSPFASSYDPWKDLSKEKKSRGFIAVAVELFLIVRMFQSKERPREVHRICYLIPLHLLHAQQTRRNA